MVASADSINADYVSSVRDYTITIKSINCSSTVPKLVEQVSFSELNKDHLIDFGSNWIFFNRKS